MGAKGDQITGHAKETAGVITGNKDLQAEGRAQRMAGEAKEATDNLKDKAAETIDKVQGAVNEAMDKAKSAINKK
jgi:uncharacterized protein YjbJ (UPF0337 family)